jgi:hypothetical protein
MTEVGPSVSMADLANNSIVIGCWVLTYSDLFSAMIKMYRTIEVIRGVSTGAPGPELSERKASY